MKEHTELGSEFQSCRSATKNIQKLNTSLMLCTARVTESIAYFNIAGITMSRDTSDMIVMQISIISFSFLISAYINQYSTQVNMT